MVISVISRVLNCTFWSVLWITPKFMRVDEHIQSTQPKHTASHQGVGVKSPRDSHEIQEGTRKMRERLIPERPAEEEGSRKGPEAGRGCASLVQGSRRT